jgi:hypothetical protein
MADSYDINQLFGVKGLVVVITGGGTGIYTSGHPISNALWVAKSNDWLTRPQVSAS